MVESIYEKLSRERKEGQAQGKYPEWYTTGAYQTFKENYEYQADGFSEQIARIAKTVAKYSPPFLEPEHPFYKRIVENHGSTWEECYYSVMWNGDFQPSTPVLSNTGTDRGCSVSCSGGAIGDSIDDFYSALREAALLTKEGFGTSAYLGGIRPRGSVISSGGKATGTWPVLDDFQTMAKKVSQSGVRRGSWAGYLEIDHPDFDEWCDNLLKNPAGLNIGWIVSKAVIQKWEDGDEEMHRRRAKALHTKMITGKGYFWKIDHVNEQQPECYKKHGLYNKASNLCTEIVLFSDLLHSYSCIISSMNCVHYNRYKETGSVFIATVFLDSLCSEFLDKARKIPGLEKVVRYTEKARSLGLGLLGLHSYLQENMIAFEEYLAHRLNIEIFSHLREESEEATKWLAETLGEPEWCKGFGRRNTHLCVSGDTKILTSKGQLPIKDLIGKQVSVWNGEEWSEVEPFSTGISELLVVKLSNGMSLKCTPDHRFLVVTPKRDTKATGGLKTIEVEASMLRVGDCLPKFLVEPSGTDKELPYAYTAGLYCGDGSINNSKGGKYPRKELRLYGDKQELSQYIDWKSNNTWGDGCVRGYLPDDLLEKYVVPHEYSVLSKQKWLAGLVDTDGGNSSGAILISMKDEHFANEVALLVQSLGGEPFVSRVKRSGGFSSNTEFYFVVNINSHSLPKVFSLFRPKRVKAKFDPIHSKIGKRHLVEVASIEKLEGKYETFCFTDKKLGQGVFNGILTKQCAIAPNVSSSTLAGQVSQGITPWYANAYLEPTASGELMRINPTFLRLAKERGKYSKTLITRVVNNKGSVQDLDWLTNHEKLVLKTAFEIDQRAILRLASKRQEFIDQGQSLNFFFSSDESEEYIAEIHKEFFLDPYLKGAYYIRSESGIQASKDTCIACES